jgi:hypothetical protein
MEPGWKFRHPDRLTDAEWQDAFLRVRSEFDEMPCLRVTPKQACALFGLPPTPCEEVLRQLAKDGYLSETDGGGYVRRTTRP